jgi:hypothetical protein
LFENRIVVDFEWRLPLGGSWKKDDAVGREEEAPAHTRDPARKVAEFEADNSAINLNGF